ncbi:glycosyltransferase [Patescibacteria group bacterium]
MENDKAFYRFLEMLPAIVSFNIILFPYWGIFLIPNVVAYFILAYNIYWFYQSFQIAVSGTISHFRIQASMQYDWMKDVKGFPDWKKVRHVIIVPTYKEPIHVLERTFKSLEKQTIPLKQLDVILAMEKKEPKEDREEKVKILKKKYGKLFGNLIITVHELTVGEAIGKSSNERYAAVWYKKNYIDKKRMGMKYLVVTSCDADHVYHPNHFAFLAYKFLDDPKRYKRFWQPAVLFYNNIWKIPAIIRVVNILSSIFNLSQLARRDRLISTSNYSLSFKLLDDAGYWDPDRIPEDWGIFFKAYFKKQGGIEAEPIYLPVYADAVESTTFKKTLKSQYEQRKRWAWGVSDTPWIIRNYLLTSGVPFWEKTMRVLYVVQSHFTWPIHFFIITIGLTLPTLLNPRFGKTTLGYMVPRLSSIVLTTALMFLGVMLVLDKIYRPKRPKYFPLWKSILSPLEFVLMPIAGFFFATLPGIDAHTRLLLGKYIEYKVTEKV